MVSPPAVLTLPPWPLTRLKAFLPDGDKHGGRVTATSRQSNPPRPVSRFAAVVWSFVVHFMGVSPVTAKSVCLSRPQAHRSEESMGRKASEACPLPVVDLAAVPAAAVRLVARLHLP